MTSPPLGTSAWRRLFSGIGRPRPPKIARMLSMSSSRRSSSTPITSAIASRVTSSGVGPRPPHTMTASARSSSSRRHCTMRSRLSPTLRCSHVSMPALASCSPIHELLVSTIWPSSSSVPMARTSHRMRILRFDGSFRCLPPRLALPLITMSRPDTTDERDREPQEDVVERRPLVRWAAAARRRRRGTGRTPSTSRACAPGARCRAGPRTTGTARRRPRARSR